MTSADGMRAAFDAVTTSAARILHLADYGLAPGCRADAVLLEARDPVEALRLRATRLAVIRAGKVVAEAAPAAATLHLDGRPGRVNWLADGVNSPAARAS
jgi:cytosine deaminase